MYYIKSCLTRFSAAHRLVKNYQGKCAHLHGPDSRVYVVSGAKRLNEYDFVMDFSAIKKYFTNWVNLHWDQATIVCADDHALIEFLEQHQQRYFQLPEHKNSTAEVLAEQLFHQFQQQLHTELKHLNPAAELMAVEIWETQKSGAIYSAQGLSLAGQVCGT